MTGRPLPSVIFEIANVHGGDVAHLRDCVAVFARAEWPRKAIKFQAFSADAIALPDFSWYSVYQELQIGLDTWGEIIGEATAHGDVWLDLFDAYGAEALARFGERVAGVKLQASVLDNVEVVDALREAGLARTRLMLNVAGHGLDAVGRYVEAFRALEPQELILQLGFQGYPTAVEDTGLQKIPVVRAAFPDLPLCFADHAPAGTPAAEAVPALAVAMGCDWVEKHVCDSREHAKYDQFSALEPDEMDRALGLVRAAHAAASGPFTNPAEAEYLRKSQQVPVAARPLRPGDLVGSHDVRFRRTDRDGLTWPAVLDRQARPSVLAGAVEPDRPLVAEDFRGATVGVVVACRLKSSRLPRKALALIHGRESVARCLDNCLMIGEAETVVLATSDLDEDAPLAAFAERDGVAFTAGHPDDVIARFLDAADAHGLDVIVRVTADCPTVSPEITSLLLREHWASGADYTAARAAAVGTPPEVYNVAALRRVIELTGGAEHSEYMTWYLRNNPDVFKVNLVDLPADLVRDYRLTLDYPEDLEVFDKLYARLDAEGKEPTLRNVFAVLDAHPELPAINADMALAYRDDPELIRMLNEKTCIRVAEPATSGAGEGAGA